MRSPHIQVTAQDYDGMMRDAETIFRNVDEKVYVKVPVDFAGVKVIKALKRPGVNVTATAIYGMDQAFIALEAGADCIAPYYNRMEALGVDAARRLDDELRAGLSPAGRSALDTLLAELTEPPS